MALDFVLNGQRPRDDWATIAHQSWFSVPLDPPSHEDLTVAHDRAFDEDRTVQKPPRVTTWVIDQTFWSARPIVVLWWRSPWSCTPCASTRRQVIGKSISLKPDFAHVCWWMIGWTRVHAIDALRLDRTLALPPRRMQKKNVWEHSPTRRKKGKCQA